MKTLREYQEFADELLKLCQKHQMFLVGTCKTEGIYGEITLGECGNPDSCLWDGAEKRTQFKVVRTDDGDIIMH